MSFAQLRWFINDAVEKLSAPSISANEQPSYSQEELLSLCDMLQEKADALKVDAPTPERPTYDGPSDPGYFTPSDELDALYREQRRAEERVDYEREHGDSRTYLEYIEAELEQVERKIAPLETKEQQEYNKRLRDYREAHKPYIRSVRKWQEQIEKDEKRREVEVNRDEAVRRMYQKVKRASEPKTITILPWEIAAPGEGTEDRAVCEYYREVLSRGGLDEFDQEHLGKILALPRSGHLMKGKAGWYGYIGLRFAHTNKVLLDCPVPDNAVYVLDSGEERLLKMNKQQLRASGETKRIFHTGDWYQRVKRELGIT
jgi:hypothetical protein